MNRRYSMIKLATGDWLLPSNDLRTLWRICREPDGWWTSMRLLEDYNTDGFPLLERDQLGTIIGIMPTSSLEWTYAEWETYGQGYTTRREAVADLPEQVPA